MLGVSSFWRNDNEKSEGRKGSKFIKGAYFLYLREWAKLSWEWNLWSRFWGIGLGISDDSGITFHIAVPPIALWFSVEAKFLRNFCFKWDWYHLEFSAHHGSLWLSLWASEAVTNYSDPWWKRRQFNLDILDLVLGKPKYSEREINSTEVQIGMPEGSYPAKIRIFESKWSRPRWFPSYLVRSRIEMIKPIPFPGKGENSWDCGEDALFSCIAPESTVEGAISNVVKSVLEKCRKYGGNDWEPSKES